MSLLLPVLILSALGGTLGPATLAAGAAGAANAADASPAAAALHALFAEEWQYALREDPLAATAVGDNRYNDRLPSMTPADLARRDEHARDVLERLHRIGHTRLGEADAVSYDLFERALSDEISEYRFKTYRQSITAEGGFHTDFSRLPEEMPLATLQDYENYLARLRSFPAYARQNTELLREGVAAGHTLPRVVLRGYTDAIAVHVVDDVTKSAFWQPFASFPAAVPESGRERLRQAGRAAIRDAVVPAYRDF